MFKPLLNRLLLPAVLLGALALPLASCDDDDDDKVQPTPEKTLYERLGGYTGVKSVVDKFLVNVVTTASTSSRLGNSFQSLINEINTSTTAMPGTTAFDVPRVRLLQHNLIDQIGEAAGGPLKYKGKDMGPAHAGMNITNAEFDALVAELSKACDSARVAPADKATLLGVLAPMRSSIVGR